MRLSADDQKAHPKLTQYVRCSLPSVIHVSLIVKKSPPLMLINFTFTRLSTLRPDG